MQRFRDKHQVSYPQGKDFAFTIFDDTDVSTLGNIKPIYDLLDSLGMRTTKSVWPLQCHVTNSDFAGSHTLENKEYAAYVKDLSSRGFEIAFHGASMESSQREKTLTALEKFKDVVGYYPRVYACHGHNRENLYWGRKRITHPALRALYSIIDPRSNDHFLGELVGSSYFWGDLCNTHIDYVRTFTCRDLNIFNITKAIPYSVKQMPYLKACFITSDADNVEEFNEMLSSRHLKKLIEQRGVCILSVHFGKGFVKKGRVNSRTQEILEKISTSNGWFAPVSDILDFLRSGRDDISVRGWPLFLLELKWFIDSYKRKLGKRPYEKTELDYLMMAK